MKIKFTLVIPTHNEAGIIKNTLEAVREQFEKNADLDWQILVVDNASTDNTAYIVSELKDEQIKVIRLAEKGRGRAVRAGFAQAKAGIVAFTDSDLSVSPEEIVAALRKIVEDGYDVVIGDRFSNKSKPKERSWRRNLSSIVFRFLARAIVGTRVNDTQCPLKMTNASSIPLMTETADNTWFNDVEFVAMAQQLPLRICEFPVQWDEGRYPNRKSTVKLVRDSYGAIVAMFKIRHRLPRQMANLRAKLHQS